MTAAGGAITGLDLTLWNWWWEFNREPLLELKSHLYNQDVRSGQDGFYLGGGYRRRSRCEARRQDPR